MNQYFRTYWNERGPYYARWAMWCWYRPVYIGLPLVVLCGPIMCVDIVITIILGLTLWGGKK